MLERCRVAIRLQHFGQQTMRLSTDLGPAIARRQ